MKVKYQMRSKQVVELVINRPEKRNAVDFDVIEQFQSHLHKLKEREDISVLIIRGEGKTFCSGGDLDAFNHLRTKTEALSMLKPMCDVLKTIATLPFITVTFLNGTAVGGGAELASATDYRFGVKDSHIGFIQGKLNITTGWGGASLLKHRIGRTEALSLLATSKRIPMEEGRKIGFVHNDVKDISEIDQWSKQWLTPTIVRQYKRLLLTHQEKESLFLSMDQEVDACASLWESDEHHEAVQAFFTRKK